MESTTRDLPHSQDYHVVPGTVYIVEQPSDSNADSKAEIILHPSPSDDLDDPLRWSAWRKGYHLGLLVIYSTLMTALGNWEASIYLNIVDALGTTVTLMNVGTALTLLMLGIGNVFFTPLSHKFGRRVTYLSSLVIAIISQIWLAVAQNAGDFIGAHVLFGLGRAPYEALVAISIADVFFAHEIGLNMGIWTFGLMFGSSMGPICSGYMVKTLHWRWVYRMGAILCAVVWVAMFFTLEETRFIRSVSQEVSSAPDGSAQPAERDSSEGPEALQQDVKGEKDGLDRENTNTTVYRLGEVLDANSFRFQFRLWTLFPGTFRDGFEYGTSVSWISVLGTTTAVLLSPSPYNFGNEALGLIWLSPLVGAFFGSYFAGPLNDQLMMFLSRRNRGWREPEFRLWSFLPTALIMPAGLILYGVGAAKGLPWIAPIIGMGFVGFGLSVAAALTMAYVVDCYKAIDGEAVTTVILIRNIIGSALTFGIQPWIDSMGVQDTFIMVAILSFVITIASGLLIIWGKKMRLLTKAAYLDFARRSE
ncbi:major facilitator superfamily domain-containing protein [Dactylonectria estremocensis]|uniref:Major facilitator superfamily domain-containing protein n=1 Tax=Dactylonectria estremocensis TaxID=1079267 RepID=A0A9P9E2L5_9HYPO|nr:major facilitator superfamily domain-containing protein [Dactylonectria estremocensis]